MSFYKSEKFKQEKSKWYAKLKEQGFEDIEEEHDEEDILKTWDSTQFRRRRTQAYAEENKEYYRVCSIFLHLHKFKDEREHRIWSLHCSGLSVRKIAVMVDWNKDLVHRTIMTLVDVMLGGISGV